MKAYNSYLLFQHKRCSNQFVGLKAHPEEKQYYYVCKPDSVIFGKCQNLQVSSLKYYLPLSSKGLFTEFSLFFIGFNVRLLF